jgi:hypothetical protein
MSYRREWCLSSPPTAFQTMGAHPSQSPRERRVEPQRREGNPSSRPGRVPIPVAQRRTRLFVSRSHLSIVPPHPIPSQPNPTQPNPTPERVRAKNPEITPYSAT